MNQDSIFSFFVRSFYACSHYIGSFRLCAFFFVSFAHTHTHKHTMFYFFWSKYNQTKKSNESASPKSNTSCQTIFFCYILSLLYWYDPHTHSLAWFFHFFSFLLGFGPLTAPSQPAKYPTNQPTSHHHNYRTKKKLKEHLSLFGNFFFVTHQHHFFSSLEFFFCYTFRSFFLSLFWLFHYVVVFFVFKFCHKNSMKRKEAQFTCFDKFGSMAPPLTYSKKTNTHNENVILITDSIGKFEIEFKDWLVGWLVDVFMEKQGKEDVLGSAFSRFSINFVQQTFFSYARFFSVLFWNQKSNENKNDGLMIKSNERKVWNGKKKKVAHRKRLTYEQKTHTNKLGQTCQIK